MTTANVASKDSLGDRMKGYENAYRYSLPNRLPVIIRVDGKAFHTLTRGCDKPFDQHIIDAMDRTALALCNGISSAKLAYVQSDEISILLTPYDNLNTQAWFDNCLQKMVSISAAIASVTFSQEYGRFALFDSRAFILPESEVTNYFIWRQQDATRNAIQMVARAHFSHTHCENKNSSQLQEMLFTEKGINFNDLPTDQKRGRCIVRFEFGWTVANDIPVFTQDRTYIETRIPKG